MKNLGKRPLVSVYMPVFNAAEFLPSAIESILSQTYSDFEFIIVDDHSTDRSWDIIKRFAKKDTRIRHYRNLINLGVSLTSNIALTKCRGKYIARMDADDISLPKRLELQLNYLKKHKDTVALGGQCVLISENDQIIGTKNFPANGDLQDMLFWAIPIQQPTMMVNTSLLPKKFKWYSPVKTSAEEVNVMFRLSKYGKLENLAENTLFYRIRPDSLSHIHPKQTFWLTVQSRIDSAINLNIKPSWKGLALSLVQVLIICSIPEKAIYSLWYPLRSLLQNGFGKTYKNHTVKSLALELTNA